MLAVEQMHEGEKLLAKRRRRPVWRGRGRVRARGLRQRGGQPLLELGQRGPAHASHTLASLAGGRHWVAPVIHRIRFTPAKPLDNLARSTVGQSPQGWVGLVGKNGVG